MPLRGQALKDELKRRIAAGGGSPFDIGESHELTDEERARLAPVFEALTGREPVNDDLERVSCKRAGQFGHYMCGMCREHTLPRFECGCLWVATDEEMDFDGAILTQPGESLVETVREAREKDDD